MSSDLDPAKLKVVDLRNELAARGLDQKGVKAVLVKRLKDYLDKEAESKGSKSETVVTKSEETPRKSARKSADEREEVKSTKSVAAPPPAIEKAKPPEKVDKSPQEKPAPPKPVETPKTDPPAIEKTAEATKPVPAKVPETGKKEVTTVQQPKTDNKPSEESKAQIQKIKVEVKSPEKPKTEVKPLMVESVEKIKIEVKSPEKPKSEAKSPEKVKCEVKSPSKLKTEVITPENPKCDIEEEDKTTDADKTSEETNLEEKSDMEDEDPSHKKPKLDDVNEEQEEATPMEVRVEWRKSKRSDSRTEHRERGEKRKRSNDSPDRSPKRQKTPPEDEPDINYEKVQLSWYDSDLHLLINKATFLSAKPINDGAFGYAWAGARATHGVSSGKVYYEVKVTEKLEWEDFSIPLERFRLDSRSRREDRRHSRRSDNRDGRKSDRERSKDKSDKAETKQADDSDKKEESMEVGDEKLEKDNGETSENTSDEKMETDSEQKPEEKNADEEMEREEEKEDVKKEKDDEEKKDVKKENDDGEKKDVEKENDDGENKDDGKEDGGEEKKDVENDSEEKNEDEKEDNGDKKKKEEKLEEPPLPTHYIRIGWSVTNSSLQLGEDKNSFAFESSGNFVKNKEFVAYSAPFDVGAVIGAYLDISDDTVTLRFSVNGELQPAIEIPKSDLPENVTLYPHVLSRNYEFEVNFGEKEEPWFAISSEVDGYNFISKVENKILGLKRPESRSDCEVLLMCGLPASGKTHWVNEHIAANADKNYTVLGNNSILDKMTVCGEPLKSKFKGKWGMLIDKIQKCLNRLVSTAALRRRNYIIDQTNVFASAQSRKMRPFEGFKRKAVIVVVGDEEQARRQALKEVPDSTILGMKAAMVLPVVGDWLEEVSYVGVDEKEAKEIIKKYNEDGRAAGFPADKRRDNRRNDHGRHFQRRSGYQQSYHSSNRRWDRPPRRDGGWKHDSRSRDWRGSNYDQRSRDYYNQGGYDRRRSNYGGRSSGGDWGNGGGGWGNRSQNSGWNQQTFGRNYNQPWNNSGNQNWNKYNNSGSGGWQGYGGNWNNYGQQGNWNQAQQYQQPPQTQQTAYSTNTTAAQSQQYSQPYNAQEAWAQYARQYAQHQQMAQAAAAATQKR